MGKGPRLVHHGHRAGVHQALFISDTLKPPSLDGRPPIRTLPTVDMAGKVSLTPVTTNSTIIFPPHEAHHHLAVDKSDSPTCHPLVLTTKAAAAQRRFLTYVH